MTNTSVDSRRFKVAVVASHPVQYQVPWYRALAEQVDVTVFFAHRVRPSEQARAGFGVEFEWDVPMLEGYAFHWLENVARRPGVDAFLGCNTPGVGRTIERGGFDAVVVNGWQFLAYWQAIRAARRAGVPVMVRGDSQLASPRGPFVRAVKGLAYPALMRAFDACLAVGDRSEAYYRRYGVPAARIHRAPHCVDNAFFAREAAAAMTRRAEIRHQLGVPEDGVVFLFAGKLVARKRPLDFVRALDGLRRRGVAGHGLMVGDGALRPAIAAHCRAHGTPCSVAGFLNQRQMPAAYAAADALVLTSTGEETWGLVVNEAMACGLPAIVSDQAGCSPDLVVPGQTGQKFSCGDVDALAHHMESLVRDEAARRAMGREAAVRITAYTPAAAAAGVVKAIESIRVRTRHALEGKHVIDVVS